MSSGADDPTPRRFFLVRLWRGELALVVTFWVFAIAGNLFVQALTDRLVTSQVWISSAHMNLRLLASIVYFNATLKIAYLGLIAVAVWRSAGRYAIDHPGRRIAAILAKLYIVCDVAYFAINMVHFILDVGPLNIWS